MGGSKTPYDKISTLNPQQKGVSQGLYDYFMPRIGQALPAYPGALTTPFEQQGLGYLGQYLGGMGTYMPQRQAAYGQALGGQMLPSIDMSASKDWFNQQVVPQYQQQFQRFNAPALEQMRGMAGVGAKPMGAYAEATAGTAADLSRYLGDQGYQYMLQEQQAQRQRDELNAQYRMGAMAAGEPQRAEQLAAVQASQQFGGLPFMREMAEWLRTRPEYSPVISQALEYLGIPMTGIVPTSNMATGAAEGAGGMLGGIGGLVSGMGGLR